MFKQVMLSVAFVSCALFSPLCAQQPSSTRSARAEPATAHRLTLPGTQYQIAVGTEEVPLDGPAPPQALLSAMATWLTNNFDLPENVALPRVTLVPAATMATQRYKGVLSDRPQDATNLERGTTPQQVVALYDDAGRTIYLPEDWTGNTPAELSVLVHEMVHHLQNLGHVTFECPQQRERLAYDAQEAWLRLFGLSLAGEFALDGFTLLVKTRCIH